MRSAVDGLRRHRDAGRIAQHRSASSAISCGMVAEKNSVCRCFGQHGDDLADVVDEAHVEHAVGFVEHEDFDLVEAHGALTAQVEQAAGRGDEHVDAVRQRRAPAGRSARRRWRASIASSRMCRP